MGTVDGGLDCGFGGPFGKSSVACAASDIDEVDGAVTGIGEGGGRGAGTGVLAVDIGFCGFRFGGGGGAGTFAGVSPA